FICSYIIKRSNMIKCNKIFMPVTVLIITYRNRVRGNSKVNIATHLKLQLCASKYKIIRILPFSSLNHTWDILLDCVLSHSSYNNSLENCHYHIHQTSKNQISPSFLMLFSSCKS